MLHKMNHAIGMSAVLEAATREAKKAAKEAHLDFVPGLYLINGMTQIVIYI